MGPHTNRATLGTLPLRDGERSRESLDAAPHRRNLAQVTADTAAMQYPHGLGCFLVLGDQHGLEPLRARLEAIRPLALASIGPDLPLSHRAIGIVLAAPSARVPASLAIVRAGLLADVPLLVVTERPDHDVYLATVTRRGLLLAQSDWNDRPCDARWIVDELVRTALAYERHVVAVRASVRRLARCELTERQMQIARCAATGRSRKQIADDLGLADSTVKNQISSILAKCGIPGASIRELRRILEAVEEAKSHEDDDQDDTADDEGDDRVTVYSR